MNRRLPDLLPIISNISSLFTCLAHLTREVDKILKSVILILNIVAEFQANLFCWHVCDTCFNLSEILPNLKRHALLQLFRVRFLLLVIPHMVFHCRIHLNVLTRFFEIHKSSLFTSW